MGYGSRVRNIGDHSAALSGISPDMAPRNVDRREEIWRIAAEAWRIFRRDIERDLPSAAIRLSSWHGLIGLALHGLSHRGIPVLSLPGWVAPLRSLVEDREFHIDLMYSTMHGFCYIRLIDDVADGDKDPELRKLLPACNYFHCRFQLIYQKHFPPGSVFWAHFTKAWDEQAEQSIADAFFETVDLTSFLSISSKKTAAARIPLAAAAVKYDLENIIAPWYDFLHGVGALQQMTNDYLKCRNDLQHNIRTFFLSTFAVRRQIDETLDRWLVREGHDWGQTVLLEWIEKLSLEARQLECPEALAWLTERRGRLLGDVGDAFPDRRSAADAGGGSR